MQSQPNHKKKVLFFLPPTVGGAERMTVVIAKMLPREEFEVKFVLVGKTRGEIEKYIPAGYSVKFIRLRNVWLFGTTRICKLVRQEQPDMLFSSFLYLNVRLILVAKLCRTRVIVRNNIDLSRTEHKINLPFVRLTYRWADRIIAQQEEMRQEIISFTGLPAEKVVTLHNPIDEEYIGTCLKADNPFPPDAQGQYKYICVARFNHLKGQDLVVKAFRSVHHDNPDAHLYLLGKFDNDNAFCRSIADEIRNSKLQNHVHIVGFDSNPYRWVSHADCFVMPSRLEGLPNALIDAMYLGKPVVATRCIPIIERIVRNSYNGIVVDPDNVEALAEGMRKATLLKDTRMIYQPATGRDFVSLFNSVLNE